ncbi:MAG TPA: GAF and ANTAR domain-containing protein [Actinophytocola sp.]|nr:GAF and ANTAR domain-containing protein [Actinophytocola sp.]
MADDILTVARELAEVTRLVEADDFGATLDRFVARIVRTIPGCDAATITVRSPEGVETVAGADLDLDPIVPGPIIEALTFVEPRRLEDTGADQRWPVFSAKLVNAGYQACLALPLATSGRETAVLTLFSRVPEQFGEIGYDIVLLLTLHAGVVFDNATLYHDSHELIGQLRTALRTRSLVGRAQGLLMRHFDYDSAKAFDTLRRASQNSNTKLRDLAELLVTAHEEGTFDAAIEKLALIAARQPMT